MILRAEVLAGSKRTARRRVFAEECRTCDVRGDEVRRVARYNHRVALEGAGARLVCEGSAHSSQLSSPAFSGQPPARSSTKPGIPFTPAQPAAGCAQVAAKQTDRAVLLVDHSWHGRPPPCPHRTIYGWPTFDEIHLGHERPDLGHVESQLESPAGKERFREARSIQKAFHPRPGATVLPYP